MIVRKPTFLLSTYNAIHTFCPGAATSNTSSKSLSTRDSRYHSRRLVQKEGISKNSSSNRRSYATIANDSRSADTQNTTWPSPPAGQHLPTPYQIFNLSKDSPYSKQRFYELVKLYHPDRADHEDHQTSSHPCYNLAQATRIERYRLVVAAHAILSDPDKRSAYDRWGAGWAGKTDAAVASNDYGRGSPSRQHPGPFTAWNDHSDPNIWANATWEDWERFRARQDWQRQHPEGQQAPRYLQNSYFVSLVVLVAMLGSTANYSRADNAGASFLEARDAVHDRASKDLRRVRQETGQRAKDERIQWFVRNREATMMRMGVEEITEEKARHVLPPTDMCMSEDLRSRD